MSRPAAFALTTSTTTTTTTGIGRRRRRASAGTRERVGRGVVVVDARRVRVGSSSSGNEQRRNDDDDVDVDDPAPTEEESAVVVDASTADSGPGAPREASDGVVEETTEDVATAREEGVREEEGEEEGDDDGDEETHEYEEYEEIVDYELHDYVADAKRAVLDALRPPDFSWNAAAERVSHPRESGWTREILSSKPPVSASAVTAHSPVGTVIALMAFWSARAVRMELEKRDVKSAALAARREMTEEERAREADLRAERRAREAEAEMERRRKRDAEEAAEKARLAELERLRLEEEAKAAEEEAKRREEMRAELRRKNAEEKERLEARLKAEAEAKAAELAAERAEREKQRLERERLEAEENARRQVECDARGEKEMTVSADTEIVMKRDNESAPVDVIVSARVGISESVEEKASFRSADEARVMALPLCSSVARRAMVAYASDARLQDMMGNGPLSRLPGMDDVEFEHWTRVMQARMDSELRTAIVRCGAALEVKLRETKRGGTESSRATTRFTRRCLPYEDEENIVRRIESAVDAVASEIIEDVPGPSGGIGGTDAASEALELLERYELGQLHGLHPSIVFPAEHPKTGLSGALMASILTLSHFITRAERLYGDDERVVVRARQLAATLVGRSASKQGSWRAMYLDGFTGDALTSAAAMADTVLPEEDAIRIFLNGAVEEQRRRLAGEERAFEEEWPDADEVRKKRLREMRENQPITERLFALRTAALQLAQSGSKQQARVMLEEAYALRKKDVAKNNKDPENTAETLPELIALVDLLSSKSDWIADALEYRVEVLKSVRVAVDAIADEGDAVAAAALLESAVGEYAPYFDDAEKDAGFEAYGATVDDLWTRAGVDASDVETRAEAVAAVVGSAGAISMITDKYTKQLEAHKRFI